MSAAPFSLCVQIGHAGPQIISQMPHNEYHVTQYSGGWKLLHCSHTLVLEGKRWRREKFCSRQKQLRVGERVFLFERGAPLYKGRGTQLSKLARGLSYDLWI